MRCRKIKQLIDAYLDREAVTPAQQERMMIHMQACTQCRRHYERTEQLQSLVRLSPTESLPSDFRSTLMVGLEANETDVTQRSALLGRIFANTLHRAVLQVVSVTTMLLLIAGLWFGRSMLPSSNPHEISIAQVLQIHVVSPSEDAVVGTNGFDVSAAFYSLEDSPRPDYNVRILLDAEDVTDATEVNEDFVIYTPDPLEPGHHLATIQLLDASGMPALQRSWTFYVLPSL